MGARRLQGTSEEHRICTPDDDTLDTILPLIILPTHLPSTVLPGEEIHEFRDRGGVELVGVFVKRRERVGLISRV